MIKLIDFNKSEIAKGVYYGGDAGAKNAVIYEGKVWMLKYPKTTRDFANPQISYTTSPLSEYLGSKIYESLNIPVHETLLGVRNNKVVAACGDFTRVWERTQGQARQEKQLVPFHDLKNSFMSGDLEAYSGSGSETLLDEVLAAIDGQDELKSIPGVKERFWDMFVADAFIGNNDRNNGNWGILIDRRTVNASLASVYDNGNAFFNKRGLAQMEKRLRDEDAMLEDAYKTFVCAFKYTGLDNEGQRINPFSFIAKRENADCNAAVARFLNAFNFNGVEEIIRRVPESAGNLSVMPEVQKAFYIRLLEIRLKFLRHI